MPGRPNRSVEMLDATIQCLIDRGYAGTSTTEIAKRAGVTPGALFRHWPTKSELVAAASARLFDRIEARYEHAFQRADARPPTVELAIEILWDFYQQPELRARTELLIAARTDADLALVFGKLEAVNGRRVSELARRLLPAIAAVRPDFDDLVGAVIFSVQGATMGTGGLPEIAKYVRASQVRVLTTIASMVLGDGSAPATEPLTPDKRRRPAERRSRVRRPAQEQT